MTTLGGCIAQWIAFLLLTQRPRVWFSAFPRFFRNFLMLLRFINSSALLRAWTVQNKCLIVNRTHLVLACGKLVLQKWPFFKSCSLFAIFWPLCVIFDTLSPTLMQLTFPSRPEAKISPGLRASNSRSSQRQHFISCCTPFEAKINDPGFGRLQGAAWFPATWGPWDLGEPIGSTLVKPSIYTWLLTWHRGSACASHPEAPGSNPSSAEIFPYCLVETEPI